jgi:hypothetical protein
MYNNQVYTRADATRRGRTVGTTCDNVLRCSSLVELFSAGFGALTESDRIALGGLYVLLNSHVRHPSISLNRKLPRGLEGFLRDSSGWRRFDSRWTGGPDQAG